MGLRRDRVVVVTGASRGAGRGIAVALGATGATVYVTGRTRLEGEAALSGTVQASADAVTAAGGRGIAVHCDHGDDSQVQALFERVRQEHGRLDVLVNNATVLHDALTDTGPFWDKPLALVDILDVGLRSHYSASWFAAPLLLANGEGLVVNTSSFGGRIYMHGPAYGAGKAGLDKMTHDMAIDFKPHGIAVISLWMGMLATERTHRLIAAEPDKYAGMAEAAETPEFSGQIIDALACDPDLMGRSGKVWIGAELAQAYGVRDADGRQPPSPRAFFGDTTVFGDAVVV
jgi:NAD(P)-dependent dehydrogenase (short-subunit alcohol dehydrogenase family)